MSSKHPMAPRPHGAWFQAAAALSKGLLATLIAGLLCARAWATPRVHQVRRSDFVCDVTGRGTVESARTAEIRSEVPSRDPQGTAVLRIVPEGTEVKAGDFLVELDASDLKEDARKQQVACAMSEAAIVEAQSRFEIAVLGKREYLEGLCKLEVLSIEGEILVAEANLRRAQEAAQNTQELVEKGYATKHQAEGDQWRLKKAQNDLKLAELRLEVLQKYTKPKMTGQLEMEAQTAKAKLKAAEQVHGINADRLARLKGRIDQCTVKAPFAGRVLYPSARGSRGGVPGFVGEGARVRPGQVLLRVVDPNEIQVKANVQVTRGARLAKGMAATLTLDAFPGRQLEGTVEAVSEFPTPASGRAAGGTMFRVIVRVDEPPPGLRVGMTASVAIRAVERPNVLQVPVEAVIQRGGKHYCICLSDDGVIDSREVTLGPGNDKSVVIRSGLEEGDQVVLRAAEFRGQVGPPELPPKSR